MPSARWTEEDLERTMLARTKTSIAASPKPSKFSNVKTQAEGITFDSKREAAHWMELRLRERAGEITHLERQVPFDLVTHSAEGLAPVVC